MLNNILSWLPFGLGASVFAGVMAWYFIPGAAAIINGVAKFVGEFLPVIGKILSEYLQALWEGFKDVIDSWQTILFVLTICVAVLIYSNVDRKSLFSCTEEVQMAIKELHKDYVFIKRKDAEKKKLKDAFTGN